LRYRLRTGTKEKTQKQKKKTPNNTSMDKRIGKRRKSFITGHQEIQNEKTQGFSMTTLLGEKGRSDTHHEPEGGEEKWGNFPGNSTWGKL